MNIYIDESGSFVSAPTTNSWCVVVAVTVPEGSRKKLEAIVSTLKRTVGVSKYCEAKLKDIPENIYLRFLSDLSKLNVCLFCVATDSGLNPVDRVTQHRDIQSAEIIRHIDRMKYQEGKNATQYLADQIKSLPPQLYAQLACQVFLLEEIVCRAINFYAQRAPQALREFRWRFDRKNTKRTDFEDSFEKLAPALMQTRSVSEPAIRVIGFDYSYMSQYEFPDGKLPEYLEQDYGIKAEKGIDIQKLVRGNIQFVDSAGSEGVQVADLLASGMRRCLRGEFQNNVLVAESLGRLTVQNSVGNQSIRLVSFGPESDLDRNTAKFVKALTRHSQRMIMRA